jgi:hypothetical protein
MRFQPVSLAPSPKKQFLLQLLFWFSVYGLLVSILLNAGIWIITGPLAHYLELAAQAPESQSISAQIIQQVQKGFWLLSVYFLLLLIATYGGLRSLKWALVLAGILIVVTLLATIFTMALIGYYGDSLQTFLGWGYWGMLGLLTLTACFFAWLIYRLFKP